MKLLRSPFLWLHALLLQAVDVFEFGIRLYTAGGNAKVFLIAMSGFVTVPLADLFQRYVFSDWDFILFVFILLTIDLITGVYKASALWDHTGKTPNTLNRKVFMIKLSEKLFVSIVWLIIVNFAKVYAESKSSFGASYVNYFGNGALASWLLWSICANLYVITKGQFPPLGLLKRLSAVNKSGNIADIEKDPVDETKPAS